MVPNKLRFLAILSAVLLCFSLSVNIQPSKADNTNLISVPSSFEGINYPGIYPSPYGGGGPYPCNHYDTSVTYNGQGTIRVDCANAPEITVNGLTFLDPECDDQTPIPVVPGDHVVFYAWIETTASYVAYPTTYATINTDILGAGMERICGCQSPTGKTPTITNGGTIANQYPSDELGCSVPFGTSTWTYVKMDYIVQSSYQADGFGGFDDGAYHTPHYIVPCLWVPAQVGEGASAWFADITLYINPSSQIVNQIYVAIVIGVGVAVAAVFMIERRRKPITS